MWKRALNECVLEDKKLSAYPTRKKLKLFRALMFCFVVFDHYFIENPTP